jgi:plastocyanin
MLRRSTGVFVLAWGLPCAAADQTIQMFRSGFFPETVEVEVGEKVTWVWGSGSHLLASGLPNGQKGTLDEPGALFDNVPIDEENPSFSYTFGDFIEGGISFFDRTNPTQIGFVGIDEGEISIRVAVVDNVFQPSLVTLFQGDSVRWEHEPNEDFHTVTSGASSSAPDSGLLFDEASSDGKPIFAYRFLAAGDFPYFCRPHETMGMVGCVFVQERFVRGDADGDGKVIITDPIAILGGLFLGQETRCCHDAFDTNDDGQVDVSDAVFALNFLFLGGDPIERPYPFPGADRTEDDLRCWGPSPCP